MPEAQDLDLSFLYEIADGSNEFIVESIDMFLQQTPQLLQEIYNGISTQDWTTTGQAAHKLKPNLGFFGMTESQAGMQEIEHMAKTGAPDFQTIAGKFNTVKNVIVANISVLKQKREEAAAAG